MFLPGMLTYHIFLSCEVCLKLENDHGDDEQYEVPSIKSMLSLRQLPVSGEVNESYIFFCQHFLKCVVGIQNFNRQLKQQYPLSKIATPSDEALALLLLENSEYRWKREFELKQQHHPQVGSSSANANNTINVAEETVLPSKYTNNGYNKHQRGYTRRYKGWTREGIERFNTILALVRQDRHDHGDLFDKSFTEEMFRQHSQEGEDGVMVEHATNWTKASNDLFDDDDGEEEMDENDSDGADECLANFVGV